MPKENRKYFSHDYESLEDREIVPLIMKYKSAGYGVFWATVELMHKYQERNEFLPFDDLTFVAIGRNLNEEFQFVKNVINDCVKKFGLFKIKSKNLCSDRVDDNILHYRKSIQQRSEAGRASAESKKRKNEVEQTPTGVKQVFNDRSTTVKRPSNEIQQSNSKSNSKSNTLAIKDSNTTTYPKRIASNASDEEIKEVASLAFAFFEKELPQDFINEQVAKIIKRKSGVLPITNIDKFISGWVKKEVEVVPEIITIDGVKHYPKKINGASWKCVWPTIKFKEVDEKKMEVILIGGFRIKMKDSDISAHKKGILIKDKFYLGAKY